MGTHTGNVLTLANSIIGVSVLAMPFCFKQCGIALAILMLLFSNIITRLACHYLMKSAIMEKRKNFEMLAFRVFGPTGKLIVELCIIGFMLGTCVAYFVIMGDLGPGIVGPVLGFEHPSALRPSVLIGIAVFVVLPLGLLKNVDSLSAICAVTIAFYFCLVLKVLGEAVPHLLDWDWMDKVYFWRPSGMLQCIPIFSMALSCQTQLFEIFDSLPSTPLDRMNAVVRSAVNMVTLFYISVGLFGYIAYCEQSFAGNLMLNFSQTITSDVIKIGFLLSVAVSFPLVIFPCRASIYSFFFSKGYELVQTGSAHIPESRFQCITLVIVTLSLVAGLLIPNIELVLGLVGSTIGVIVCLIIPAIIFVSLTNRKNNERLAAKFVLCTGFVILVLGTYANLYATEEAVSGVERNIPVSLKKDESPSLPKILGKVDIKDETLKNLKDVDELAALPELKPLPKLVEKVNIPLKKEKEIRKLEEIPVLKVEPKKDDDVKPLYSNPNAILETNINVANELDKPVGVEKSVIEEPEKSKIEKVDNVDVKEELIEKIKEHEEAQKKLNEESVKLLKKLKDVINHDDSNSTKDSLKLVNVKTGAVTDIKTLKSNNDGDQSVQMPKEKTSENDVLTNNIVKGIPLPLAIKGKLMKKDKQEKEEVIKKENEVVEKADFGRDILENGKEVREKRDIEETVKEGAPLTERSLFVMALSQSLPLASENNVNQSQYVKLAAEPGSKVFYNETEQHSHDTVPDKSLTLLKTSLENCAINDTSGASQDGSKLENSDNKVDVLVKSPFYLSNSNPILNESPQILSGNVGKADLPEMPKKRDLKSVVDELTENKQRNS